MYEIEHYLTANGRTNPYLDWLKGLRDNQIKVAVIRRISRIELGNFGDHRFCRDGVWELRIDAGPGYRVERLGAKIMRSKRHDEAMAALYRDDPGLAADLINSVLEDGDQAELLIALRQLTLAFGGVQSVAMQASLNPTQLYRTLSPSGNPALSSLTAILKAMGLRLAVQPLDPSHAR